MLEYLIMASLLILAYNEENTIEEVIEKYFDHFENIILIDDFSSDSTQEKYKKYKDNQKFYHNKNKKNLGAGKSFEIGIDIFNKIDSKYLLKIDGDNQFSEDDILYLAKKGEDENYDFIKCDRFWEGGIKGDIPFIRYLGNALASFFIKLTTGNWKINDPLNGLFFISKNVTKNFKVPKLFKRYGYPFYLVSYVITLAKERNLKIGQYQNTVTYGEEKSQLRANIMFLKLLYFTVISYIKKIKVKLKFSNLQFSALIDIFSIGTILISIYSIYRIFKIENLFENAPRGSWYISTILFLIISILLIVISQKLENEFESNKLTKIRNHEYQK